MSILTYSAYRYMIFVFCYFEPHKAKTTLKTILDGNFVNANQ